MRLVLVLIAVASSLPAQLTGGFVSPELATCLGDTYQYAISGIATDAAGYTYVVGSRQLGGLYFFAVDNIVGSLATIYDTLLGGSDVFVSKLDPLGNLVFTDTFAGKGVDTGTAIALDPSGNIYIAGTTTSSDFPLSKALQTQSNTLGTGFVMKLSNDGSTILYSTYFGGMLGSSAVAALATDSQGNLYLSGTTTSADFPHTSGMPFGTIAPASAAVFLASISAAGDRILYSGAIPSGPIPIAGGTVNPSPAGIAVDAEGNAYFPGNLGGGAPAQTTPGVLQATGSYTGFAAKIGPGGKVGYLTYLPTFVAGVALDAAGDLYLGGYNLGEFPDSPSNAQVFELNSTASAIVWSNNFGGLADSVRVGAVDASGNVWATGTTSSSAFPNRGWTTGPEFLAEIGSAGSSEYSALYPTGTVAQAAAVDPSGLVHLAGLNGFVSTFLVSPPPDFLIFDFQNAFGGNATARVSPAEVISIYGPGIGPAAAVTATPVNGFYPKTLGGVQVTINGADMPLLYVSANQINAVVPMEVATGAAATIRVVNGAAVTPGYPVWIDTSDAQAFPTVLNQDGTVNSQADPAKAGSVVTFYATGWQSNFAPLADGQVATMANNDACTLSCGEGAGSTVLYAGAAPGIVAGVTQFNVQVSAGASSGASAVTLYLINSASLTETVWVTP